MCSMITGLLTPSSGTIRVWGNTDSSSRASQGSLGICTQHTTLFEDLTVHEHLLLFARVKGMSTSEAVVHVDQMLAEAGLVSKGSSFPGQLSGGMKRKLAICLALVGNPAIAVLDEPTTGLDPMAREAAWDVIRRPSSKEGGCIILTTHMLEEAEALTSDILIMSAGKLIAQGSSQQLKDVYGSGYILTVECLPHQEDQTIAELGGLLSKPGLKPWRRNRPGQLEFSIGSDHHQIGAMFQSLSSRASNAGIVRWGVNQSSLQDAYLAIVKAVQDSGHLKCE